jgi:hypothetical protein
MARRPARKTADSRLTGVERGIKSLQATMRDGFSQLESRFAHIENRLEQIYNQVDGFMKLHETLDIEFRLSRSRCGVSRSA